MNTTITKDQMILHDGEVYVITKEQIYLKDYTWNGYRVQQWFGNLSVLGKWKITHSTAKLEGVIQMEFPVSLTLNKDNEIVKIEKP